MLAQMEKKDLEIKEYEAVENFIMKCFRNGDFDSAVKAHYREGKIIDNEWVNDIETEYEVSISGDAPVELSFAGDAKI